MFGRIAGYENVHDAGLTIDAKECNASSELSSVRRRLPILHAVR